MATKNKQGSGRKNTKGLVILIILCIVAAVIAIAMNLGGNIFDLSTDYYGNPVENR